MLALRELLNIVPSLLPDEAPFNPIVSIPIMSSSLSFLALVLLRI